MYHLCVCLIENVADKQLQNLDEEVCPTVFNSEDMNEETKSLALEVIDHPIHIVDQILVRKILNKFFIKLYDILVVFYI